MFRPVSAGFAGAALGKGASNLHGKESVEVRPEAGGQVGQCSHYSRGQPWTSPRPSGLYCGAGRH